VSYDYVDGNGSEAVHHKMAQRKSGHNSFYTEHREAFDEQEEDEYVEEFRAQRSSSTRNRNRQRRDVEQPQSEHNEHSLNLQDGINLEVEQQDEGQIVGDGHFQKWWTVKFPRRQSKVGLFGGNKGYKTQIALDHEAGDVVLRCDASNNKLLTKIAVREIKNIELSEKKNVAVFLQNGRKYKIKCDAEKEATTWFNALNRFVRSAQ